MPTAGPMPPSPWTWNIRRSAALTAAWCNSRWTRFASAACSKASTISASPCKTKRRSATTRSKPRRPDPGFELSPRAVLAPERPASLRCACGDGVGTSSPDGRAAVWSVGPEAGERPVVATELGKFVRLLAPRRRQDHRVALPLRGLVLGEGPDVEACGRQAAGDGAGRGIVGRREREVDGDAAAGAQGTTQASDGGRRQDVGIEQARASDIDADAVEHAPVRAVKVAHVDGDALDPVRHPEEGARHLKADRVHLNDGDAAAAAIEHAGERSAAAAKQ